MSEENKPSLFGKIALWLKAEGRHAAIAVGFLSMAAVGIWGGKDALMMVLSISGVVTYLIMSGR